MRTTQSVVLGYQRKPAVIEPEQGDEWFDDLTLGDLAGDKVTRYTDLVSYFDTVLMKRPR